MTYPFGIALLSSKEIYVSCKSDIGVRVMHHHRSNGAHFKLNKIRTML